MKTQELNFDHLDNGTVRASRCFGDELLSQRGIGDLSTAVAVIASFMRDYPKGKVQMEVVTHDAKGRADWEVRPIRHGGDLVSLFS